MMSQSACRTSASSRRTRSAKKSCNDDAKSPSKVLKLDQAAGPKMKRFALLACGSFNPVTNMHLRMFEVGRNYLQNEFPGCLVSKGIISPVSDEYGKKGLEDSKHRLKMCSLATKSSTWLEVSNWECRQGCWSPTLNVLEHISKTLNDGEYHIELLLLCGSDFLESFNTPGLWKSCDIAGIVKDYGLLVLRRPGFASNDILETHDIISQYKSRIHMVVDEVVNDTSSTSVRKLLRAGQSVKYLTPDNVVQYILKHNLYATVESENRNANIELKPLQVNRNS